MKPHQERVINERSELADKVDKLTNFFYGEIYNSLTLDEQLLLHKQHVL